MLYPPKIFRFIRPVHVHLKTDKVDLKKKHRYIYLFLHIFEKRCRMSENFFCLFQRLETYSEVLLQFTSYY